MLIHHLGDLGLLKIQQLRRGRHLHRRGGRLDDQGEIDGQRLANLQRQVLGLHRSEAAGRGVHLVVARLQKGRHIEAGGVGRIGMRDARVDIGHGYRGAGDDRPADIGYGSRDGAGSRGLRLYGSTGEYREESQRQNRGDASLKK